MSGLHCPRCDAVLNTRHVATSYAQPEGQLRMRVCECGAEVSTFEKVIPSPASNWIVVTGIAGHDLGVLRRIVNALGGVIWKGR